MEIAGVVGVEVVTRTAREEVVEGGVVEEAPGAVQLTTVAAGPTAKSPCWISRACGVCQTSFVRKRFDNTVLDAARVGVGCVDAARILGIVEAPGRGGWRGRDAHPDGHS